MRRYRGKTNNHPKSIFDEEIDIPKDSSNDYSFNRSSSNRYQLPSNNNRYQTDNPIINEQTDNIHLTSENYRPNQALIDITGFNDIAAFINNNDKSHSMNAKHDNSFDDYNEEGKNNINESSYRQMLIKQMTDSVFQQSRSMFGDMKQSSKSSVHRTAENQYDVDNTYTPSKAPSLYLQKQSKRIFRDSNN